MTSLESSDQDVVLIREAKPKSIIVVYMNEGGYPKELFEESNSSLLQSFVCSICDEVIRDAKRVNTCGHVFCDWCISKWMKQSTTGQKCPNCQGSILSVVTDSFVDRTILSCPIRCGQEQCEWRGEVAGLKEHRKRCLYTRVPCPFNMCPMLTRVNMEAHILECPHRIEMCEQCKQSVPLVDMGFHVTDRCPRRIVECPNKCTGGPEEGSGLKRKKQKEQPTQKLLYCDLEKHLSYECPLATISCPYFHYGCTFPDSARHIVNAHLCEDAILHTSMIPKPIQEQKKAPRITEFHPTIADAIMRMESDVMSLYRQPNCYRNLGIGCMVFVNVNNRIVVGSITNRLWVDHCRVCKIQAHYSLAVQQNSTTVTETDFFKCYVCTKCCCGQYYDTQVYLVSPYNPTQKLTGEFIS